MLRWAAAFVVVLGAGSCGAAEFVYDLPGVLGSPRGELNLAVDLGGEFVSISEARLRVGGFHTPGLLGDLSSSHTFPYPAAIDAYSPATPFEHSGILGELLPSVAGPFVVDEAFHRVRPGGQPDFSTWLDGTANFYFSAGPSAYILIYRTVADPVVNITSATLVVTGERRAAAIGPTGDFDGDGLVDGDDLGMWQSAFAPAGFVAPAEADADGDADADGADFLAWQRQVGSGVEASAASIPEPGSLALVVVGMMAMSAFYGRARHTLSRRLRA
jgi:hypothetical protein